MGVDGRLPKGVWNNEDTYFGALREHKDHKMHSCMVYANEWKFLGVRREDEEACECYSHPDYLIQVSSDNLFNPSIRNHESK